MNIIDISAKINGFCLFRKKIYWRYSPGKSDEKNPGHFSDSKRKNLDKLNERIVLAFKKDKRYRIYFSQDGIFIIYGEKAKATLPVMPISLPRNMGVYRVTDENDNDYIPVPLGQGALIKADKLLNDLLGSVWYELRNFTVVFSKDITLLGVSTVNMYLVVMDISLYSNTDPLPIPAGAEDEIIEKVFAKFAIVTPETGIVDNYSAATNKIN